MQPATPSASADTQSAIALRGWGVAGSLATLVVLAGNLLSPLVSAALALLWAHWSRTPWHALGFVQPKSWTRSVAFGVALGAGLKLLTKALVMPLLGAPDSNATYHFLVGNTAALPGIVATMIVVAGFGEETVYRGYLFERLRALFGGSGAAKVAILLVTSALFALAHHHDQGIPGVELAAMTGVVFGSVFLLTREIWTAMFAHAAFDLTAVALIYWDLEAAVAHLIFAR